MNQVIIGYCAVTRMMEPRNGGGKEGVRECEVDFRDASASKLTGVADSIIDPPKTQELWLHRCYPFAKAQNLTSIL